MATWGGIGMADGLLVVLVLGLIVEEEEKEARRFIDGSSLLGLQDSRVDCPITGLTSAESQHRYYRHGEDRG